MEPFRTTQEPPMSPTPSYSTLFLSVEQVAQLISRQGLKRSLERMADYI